MEKNQKILVKNKEEMQKIAQDFAIKIKNERNASIFLKGNLGAGKTFFITETLKTLDVKEDIASPTFIFQKEYITNQKAFFHFDFYRLPHPNEFFARGLEELASDNEKIKFVEWPEKLSQEGLNNFTGKKWEIKITHGEIEEERTIIITEKNDK